MIYIICFAISAGLIYLYGRVKNRSLKITFVVISILIPSLLAGFRAGTIGYDVKVYGIPFYTYALNAKGLFNYFKMLAQSGSVDYGFRLLVYLCSLFSKDYHLGLFAYQLVTLIFVHLGLFRCKKIFGTPMVPCLLLYYLFLYNNSLNIMRQTVAASIVFFAFTFLFEHKYKTFVVLVVMAFTMHTSAFFAILYLPLYLFACDETTLNNKKQMIRTLILVVAFLVVLMTGTSIIKSLINFGILRSTFIQYLAGGEFSLSGSETKFSTSSIIVFVTYLGILIVCKKWMDMKKMDAYLFIIISTITLIICIGGPLVASHIVRMNYYFIPEEIVAVSNATLCFKKKGNTRRILLVAVLLLALAYWIVNNVIHDNHQTIPYIFYWNA